MVRRVVPLALSLGPGLHRGDGPDRSLVGPGSQERAAKRRSAPKTEAAEEGRGQEGAGQEGGGRQEGAREGRRSPPSDGSQGGRGQAGEAARRAVAEAIVAAQDAGLVDTSIDPPPILDILIKGYAIDARTLKNPSAKKTYWAVTPEVFCGWFTGYGKRSKASTINPQTDIRIVNPSAGLKAWYDQRATMLNRHIDEVRKAKGRLPRAKPAETKKEETKPAETKKEETKPAELKKEEARRSDARGNGCPRGWRGLIAVRGNSRSGQADARGGLVAASLPARQGLEASLAKNCEPVRPALRLRDRSGPFALGLVRPSPVSGSRHRPIEAAPRDAQPRLQGDRAAADPVAGLRGGTAARGLGRADHARGADGVGPGAAGLPGATSDPRGQLLAAAARGDPQGGPDRPIEVEPTEAAIAERITLALIEAVANDQLKAGARVVVVYSGLRGRGARLADRHPAGRAPRTAHRARPAGAGDLGPVRDPQGRGRRRPSRSAARGARARPSAP